MARLPARGHRHCLARTRGSPSASEAGRPALSITTQEGDRHAHLATRRVLRGLASMFHDLGLMAWTFDLIAAFEWTGRGLRPGCHAGWAGLCGPCGFPPGRGIMPAGATTTKLTDLALRLLPATACRSAPSRESAPPSIRALAQVMDAAALSATIRDPPPRTRVLPGRPADKSSADIAALDRSLAPLAGPRPQLLGGVATERRSHFTEGSKSVCGIL